MPSTTSRRRPQQIAIAQAEMTEKAAQLKRRRVESPLVLQQQPSSVKHGTKSVATAWDLNDRYIRRKKRERMHEVAAAQEAQQYKEEFEMMSENQELPVDSGKLEENRVSPMKEVEEDDMLTQGIHSPMQRTRQNAQQSLVDIDPTPEKSVPGVVMATKKPKKNVARGIAQSSSSTSTRKRMISFSPERTPRLENQELALKKLEKNIKTNEKLQQRLKAPTPVKSPAMARSSSHVLVTQTRRPVSFTSPQTRRPISCMSSQTRRLMTFQSPETRQSMTMTSLSSQSPVLHSSYATVSCSLPLSQTEELDYDVTQDDQEKEVDILSTEALVFYSDCGSNEIVEEIVVETEEREENGSIAKNEEDTPGQSQNEVDQSQESVCVFADQIAPLSQESCDSNVSHAAADTSSAQTDTSLDAFTSTSMIGDVGLFNCEADVEYTGGVYGEGTDGKVTAAVINGQKVALKRAKPHDGFSKHDAKRRAALELHYLRRVRHMKGFLQCVGLCDAIEHTCIALEVMDCKLSDYLRRYGVNSGGSKRRRYTLSFDDTKAMLKQICLSMITLHEDINVAHGDLACRNILMRTPPEGYELSWEPDIKLSDFGRIKLPSDEPKILDSSFSFHKNCDVGAFGREILYRLLVGEIVPKEYVETRSLHKLLLDVTVTQVPEAAKARLGPYFSLFMRCTAWGVRPTFREIYEHLDDLQHFETSENGLFPLKPTGTDSTFMSPMTEDTRRKTPTSSASMVSKRDTPTGPGHCLSRPKLRMSSSRTLHEASVPNSNKPVNWLKTRSVGIQRTVPQQTLTPTTLPMLIKRKKTPPSAGVGASRRSLQILNQIQHRTIEKGRKFT